MNFDLSSQIVLDKIPKKFIKPENEYELSELTRFEKIPTYVFESTVEASEIVARNIAERIKASQKQKKMFSIALPGGNSPKTIYRLLVEMYKRKELSFKNVIVFNIYEFYPLFSSGKSNMNVIWENFISQVDIAPKNVHTPDGFISKDKILNHCHDYEQLIENAGGLDYALLGIGREGNIGLNITGSNQNSRTRLVMLDIQSKKEATTLFESMDKVPQSAVTMGLATILKAKEIAVIAWGEDKAKSVSKIVEDPVSDQVPASILQLHPATNIYADINAAEMLTRFCHPWLVSTNTEWSGKMIRKAVIWLCEKIDKPILKLTNKDYRENGLEDMLTEHNSAYDINIKIFNDLQHTITGWPGGKPNADDSNRPERAWPFPKKVIIFSPHPDDDVISMGGTFKRLVDQKHEVHVAYQTSGNIAVGDEEVIRYVSVMEDLRQKFSPDNEDMRKKNEEMLKFLMHDKKKGDVDTDSILFMKGHIRRQEALTACRYMGMDTKNVRFLDLPFYETGRVEKKPISEEDVHIVMDYLQSVQPHQIFVAGDLADPHGTHKVSLNAILAALEELRGETWLRECRVWMYRGAWAEWSTDHIEMAVPISPEELRYKRNAILKHQSQMESAPFLGNDERLFWQRSEERNMATAEIYRKLGLAAYEAIEAFVEYKMF